jgi:hypothetical protein
MSQRSKIQEQNKKFFNILQNFKEKICSLISHRFLPPNLARSNFSIRKWYAFRIWYAPRSGKADGKYAELLILAEGYQIMK